MFLNDAVVAKGRVVKREAIVLVQQVAQELLPDFNGGRAWRRLIVFSWCDLFVDGVMRRLLALGKLRDRCTRSSRGYRPRR